MVALSGWLSDTTHQSKVGSAGDKRKRSKATAKTKKKKTEGKRKVRTTCKSSGRKSGGPLAHRSNSNFDLGGRKGSSLHYSGVPGHTPLSTPYLVACWVGSVGDNRGREGQPIPGTRGLAAASGGGPSSELGKTSLFGPRAEPPVTTLSTSTLHQLLYVLRTQYEAPALLLAHTQRKAASPCHPSLFAARKGFVIARAKFP